MLGQDSPRDFVLYPHNQQPSAMLAAFEPSRHHPLTSPFEDMDPSMNQSYPDMTLNHFNPFSHSYPAAPSTYYDGPSLFVSAPPPTEIKMEQYHPAAPASPSMSASHSIEQPSTLSNASGQSIPSAASSNVGSPYSGHRGLPSQYADGWTDVHGLGLMNNDSMVQEVMFTSGMENDVVWAPHDKLASFVDPQLIHNIRQPSSYPPVSYSEEQLHFSSSPFHAPSPIPSPIPSEQSQHPQMSPYLDGFQPYPQAYDHRRPSIQSIRSNPSRTSTSPRSDDVDSSEKGRCPHPDCGRVFKDLKAHMLTHQSERPEKCPILNCEYNQKGFARKYDKNRHTLTHYKGTMVCGFCPGSGSSAEKSFNRADVFKRHLTSVHGVEQSPPNARKRSPAAASQRKLTSYSHDATGKCSTCSSTFSNAQDFYEHLDECVLRVVQQEEPSEAINQQRLTEISSDPAVRETMERHNLSTETMPQVDGEEEDDDDDDDERDPTYNAKAGKGAIKTNKTAPNPRATLGNTAIAKTSRTTNGGPRRVGMTYSRGGVPLVGKGRKKRKHYPPSWGCSMDKMKMKKRVLCVYDGPRRLWKDDMMLDNEFEVRVKLPDGKSYVTDLDVETLKRADALHGATEEEKGPWIPELQEVDINELMR